MKKLEKSKQGSFLLLQKEMFLILGSGNGRKFEDNPLRVKLLNFQALQRLIGQD